MTSIYPNGTARMPDDKPAVTEIPESPSLQRIRHVPDWEIPVNPPKRPFLTRDRVSRSWRHSRLATALKPRPSQGSRSALGPASVDSLPKETADSLLPTHRRSSFQSFPTPPATPGGSLPARCRARFVALFSRGRDRKCCGLTRPRFILLLILLILAIIALALGLGLGLGLKKDATRQLPLPDNGDPTRLYEGDLTFFKPALGACGWVSSDADYICAVGHELFDAAGANANAGGNPNLNPLCGRMIRVSRAYSDEVGHPNTSVDVMVVDRCTGCGPTDLDLASSAFNRLAPETRGGVAGRWEWLPMSKQ